MLKTESYCSLKQRKAEKTKIEVSKEKTLQQASHDRISHH